MFKSMVVFLLVQWSLTTPLLAQFEHQDTVETSSCAHGISDYVKVIFQDSRGHFWMDTHGRGVCRFNGDSVEYFSIHEGFGGIAVRGILEDQKGQLWFATSGGVTCYNGQAFVNYTQEQGLNSNDVLSILLDQKGNLWAGTTAGLCRLNGERFSSVELPQGTPKNKRGITNPHMVQCMLEDRQGRIWLGTSAGVLIYDTNDHILRVEALGNYFINDMTTDRAGNLWFATQFEGMLWYDGHAVVKLNQQKQLFGNEASSVFLDQTGTIWCATVGHGIYQYDGTDFINYHTPQGLTSHAIYSIYEDQQGRLWVGGWRGLYRLEQEQLRFVAVNQQGPW